MNQATASPSKNAPDLAHALRIAKAAARHASTIAMAHFQQPIEIERKADLSPVTIADRACEEAIRKIILNDFPEHAIYGEEYGRSGEHACLWLIDPIDGTRSFIRGLEFWSVQIALMVGEELVLGVSAAPPFDELAWAVRGQGAWLGPLLADSDANVEPLQVDAVDQLDKMDLSLGNVRSLAKDPAAWRTIGQFVEHASRTRGYGDFYPYHRLAAGRLDAVIESDVNILDIAALTVIVQEAGGMMTQLDGNRIGLDSSTVLAATPELHSQLKAHMNDR
ncbi:MAG: inositol monophosphatase family protein [Pseudomonadota bacterium]